MPEKFLFQFNEEGLDQIIEKTERMRQAFEQLRGGQLGEGFQRFFDEFDVGTRRSIATIQDLRRQIEQLQTRLGSARFTDEIRALQAALTQPEVSRRTAQLVPGLLEGQQTGARGQRLIQAEIAERETEQLRLQEQLHGRIVALQGEEANLAQINANAEQRREEALRRQANLAEFTNRLEATRVQQLQQVQQLKPTGDRLRELILQRQTNLLERQRQLQDQLAQAAGRTRQDAPRAALEALREEERLAGRVAAARERLVAAEAEVARRRQEAAQAGLAEADQSLASASDEERTRFLETQLALQKELEQASNRETEARRILVNAEAERAENLRQIQALEELGGGGGQQEILNRIQQINDEYNKLILNSEQAIRDLVGPEFRAELDQVEAELAALGTKKVLSPDEEQRLAELTVRAKQLIDQFDRIPQQGIPLPLNQEELERGLGLVNRLLIGAARDFSRRFTATLQFAISGTLLFGAQRLVREFFDAAVEVERTFADIGTALEFDIEEPRGTAAFERALEGVRRQVLAIADEFNALPTEVNEVAFQMVSRFRNVDAAMVATRAQILATRIATIDQVEALRALTAVAEAAAIQHANVGDEMERDALIANEYAKALDFATAIQQRFGVPLEETLEGAAGLIEVMQSLGFTTEETFAIIATTVRKTGATGQQVTDSLGRAFSQFAAPETRNQILELANTFEQLELAPADFFESGRTAFFKIIDQWQDLDEGLQRRIQEIIGQRRETRFIAPLLEGAGAGLLDEVIGITGDAADFAENRLKVLLQTVQGTIEGVSTEFQTLAQNLSELGIITPIRLFLSTVEGALKLINEILFKTLDLFELFNRIRIPIANWGLGDALKTMIGIVTAAVSLRSIFASIQKVAQLQGATTFLDVLARFTGLGAQGEGRHLAEGAIAAGGFSSFFTRARHADSLMSKLGRTIRTSLTRPIDAAIRVIAISQLRLQAWILALRTGETTTIHSTGAEFGLTAARLRTAAATAVATVRELGFLGTLALVGTGLRNLASFIFLRFLPAVSGVTQVLLAVVGAFIAVRGAIQTILSIAERLLPGQQFDIGDRATELQDAAEASGESLSVTEARMQAVTERIEELNESLESGEAAFGSFASAFLGPFRDIFGGEAAFPGTEAAARTELAELGLEAAFLQLQQVQEDVVTVARRAQSSGKDISEGLDPIRETLETLRAGLEQFNAEDLTIAGEEVTLEEFQRRVREQERLIARTERALDGVTDVLEGYAEALTPDQVAEGLKVLQQRLSLGDVDTSTALTEVQRLRDEILRFRTQAAQADERDEVEKATEQYLATRQLELQLFQQDLQERLDLIGLISDRRARIQAELRAQRDALAAAEGNISIGPEIEKQLQQDILENELELIDAINEEARNRAQFEVEFAKTFEDRQEAYRRLRDAIIDQILARHARDVGVSGGIVPTVEEEEALAGVERDVADDQLRQAKLIARNTILRRASALDQIAAIAATVAALQAELAFLKQQEAEYEEIVAKEIEIRDAIAQQRIAEADRRAAFFQLTAGVGDEIASAQADLRAAQDRLDVITSLNAEETQQGYEAELEVLKARRRLVELALRQADLQRRVNSDLTDSFEQALLDVQAAQEALRRETGAIEKLEAEKQLAEAESRAQREFYDRRLSDLDFLFQTDQIGRSQYIAGLRALQQGIDRTTRQGEELWRQIELQIRGLQEDASQAFNIPTEIQLPTLFEVRRSLAADAMGVNYNDSRQQEINIFVSDEVDVQAVVDAIDETFGSSIDLEAQRLSSGGAGITIGGF